MISFTRFDEGSKGTYVGAVFDVKSQHQIIKLQDALGIANPVPADKLHVTVLYSRNPIAVNPIEYSYVADAIEIESWEDKEGQSACVLKLSCPELSKRHDDLILQGGTHDYPDYTVHVTLSYNHKMPTIPMLPIKLNITGEYVEELKLKWADGLK